MLAIGKRVMQQAMPDQFIDGIVATNVFAQEAKFSGAGEEAGGVQSARV